MKIFKLTNIKKSNFVIIILLISFSLLITSTLQKAEKQEEDSKELVHELDDTNFETLVNSGQQNSWFLVFYVDTCPHCKKTKEIINKISMSKPNILKERDNNANTKIGLVDCDKNNFNCFRFKISRVPYIIKINKNYMYEFSEYPTIENFVKFMLQKNNPEEGLEIPKVMGYLDFFISSLNEVAVSLNDFIEDYLRKKFEIDIEWKMEYTIVMLLIWICLIVIVEILILKMLCGKNVWGKKDNKVIDGKENQNQNKNQNQDENKNQNENEIIKEDEDKKNK